MLEPVATGDPIIELEVMAVAETSPGVGVWARRRRSHTTAFTNPPRARQPTPENIHVLLSRTQFIGPTNSPLLCSAHEPICGSQAFDSLPKCRHHPVHRSTSLGQQWSTPYDAHN